MHHFDAALTFAFLANLSGKFCNLKNQEMNLGLGIALGTSMGVAFGSTIGAVMGDVLMGVALGIPLGSGAGNHRCDLVWGLSEKTERRGSRRAIVLPAISQSN
jgi:hypothetical protein